MNRSKLPLLLATGALGAFALLSSPAQAQNQSDPIDNRPQTSADANNTEHTRDFNNLGWLGALGLLGLIPRKRHHSVDEDREPVSTTTSDRY
ncbi:TrbC/VirB2 family protein [Leptolyngbya sp. FACHB-261]|uniref:TrbC/VirB2 family protein n=1 Tax=Leptolyngbya sp. FACHB-261 TaxID=2692806 RepID=UPI0016865AEF|nr:TrbC/VirB2 family protein [Leptolyngbya sp. FACHB-261]MBD2100529.1 TrbC/VirB2 family protein [Leptolyngbya sp. FACHB-261]